MAFVQFSRVCLAFGDRDILKNITINLGSGTRAALAGANGSGKSTLMKILAGLIERDSGDRAVQKDCLVAYLPQSGIVHSNTSLRNEADRAFEKGYSLHAEMEDIGDELAKKADDTIGINAKKNLVERYSQIHDFLEESGWYRRSVLAEQVLFGLGFSKTDLDRRVEEFSGGWQMRIALAKVLLQNPDILLLDEPTNYLDIEARTWLEDFLRKFHGGFLIVSHDRYFLDVTVNEVYELFNGELHRYAGNYSHYEDIRRAESESLVARYEIQQQEIRKLEDFVRRFRYKASKAAQAQERLKQLEKMQRIEIPESLKKVRFSFPPAPHAGRLIMTLEKLTKAYNRTSANGEEKSQKHIVIHDLDLIAENGDRLLVVGRNGAGKSTLLRILAGVDSDYTGIYKIGNGVQIGYFSQDNAETMTGNISILDMLEQEAPLELVPKLRDMLGNFLFRGDDVYKRIDVLSGGEKSRLALLRLLLKPVNVLILDEPTNHLDLHSKDVLLDALKQCNATVIFVSHDRGFMSALASRVLELNAGIGRQFPGSYDYYLEQTQDDSGVSDKKITPTADDVAKKESAQSGLSYEEQKKLRAANRKIEKEAQRLMEAVTALEEEKNSLELQLNDPVVYSDGKKSLEIRRLIEQKECEIEKLSAEWEKVSALLL
ncbi:MAG: ABC-F family ATP-binding cassette domain-containing protein [Spirochaetales bacterium]